MKVVAELVDGCHLKCALCWNRNRKPDFRNMPLDVVEMVIDKYGSKGRGIDWYNWGEPLLHKDFVTFSDMVKGTKSRVSSSLSFKLSDDKREALVNFIKVVVSLSGMTEDIYRYYHHGGDFKTVIQNLESLTRKNVRVQWLEHPLNAHQLDECKEYCRAIGVEFFRKGLNCEVENLRDGFKHKFIKTYRVPRPKCYIKNDIVIGADGEYLLCCASHNVKIGLNIRDDVSHEEIIAAKDKVKLCQECSERGLWKMF